MTGCSHIIFYGKRHAKFMPYFTKDNESVCCNIVEGLLKRFGVTEYDLNVWRLFADSSKRRLKCVLLHYGNTFGYIGHEHSTAFKEKYNEIKFVLEKKL